MLSASRHWYFYLHRYLLQRVKIDSTVLSFTQWHFSRFDISSFGNVRFPVLATDVQSSFSCRSRELQVRHMWYDGQLREVMASDTWRKYVNSRGFENLARVASLCNRAKWAPVPEDKPALPLNKREILGDASDTALLRCMETLTKGGADFFRKDYVKVTELSRVESSDRQGM